MHIAARRKPVSTETVSNIELRTLVIICHLEFCKVRLTTMQTKKVLTSTTKTVCFYQTLNMDFPHASATYYDNNNNMKSTSLNDCFPDGFISTSPKWKVLNIDLCS